jgi:glyoxylase I family protein
MLKLGGVHHIAIICSNYSVSKRFYTEVLGLQVAAEHFREERNSYKLDLKLNDQYIIELFSFVNPPKRTSGPEATGLRHLAFAVDDLDEAIAHLTKHGVKSEPIRVDPFTRKRFTFFADPDDLPLEFYER